MALNIEYGDPDYHRVVLKLVALSHLGYLLDNNATNNPNNTYIFQPDFLRYVQIKLLLTVMLLNCVLTMHDVYFNNIMRQGSSNSSSLITVKNQ